MRAIGVWILAVALACGAEEREPVHATPAPAPAEPAAAPAPSELGARVGEIRQGIRDLPSRVESDRVAARRGAVDLYATRMEALERRWGVRGSEAPDSMLARTVMVAEASFHDLLALLNRETAPDSAEVAAGVAALDARFEAVLAAAGQTR
jgi:hypothetical protein